MNKLRARFQENYLKRHYGGCDLSQKDIDDVFGEINDQYRDWLIENEWQSWQGCYNALLEPDDDMNRAGKAYLDNALGRYCEVPIQQHTAKGAYVDMLKQWGEGDE